MRSGQGKSEEKGDQGVGFPKGASCCIARTVYGPLLSAVTHSNTHPSALSPPNSLSAEK